MSTDKKTVLKLGMVFNERKFDLKFAKYYIIFIIIN